MNYLDMLRGQHGQFANIKTVRGHMAPNGSHNHSILIHGLEHDALAPVFGQLIARDSSSSGSGAHSAARADSFHPPSGSSACNAANASAMPSAPLYTSDRPVNGRAIATSGFLSMSSHPLVEPNGSAWSRR